MVPDIAPFIRLPAAAKWPGARTSQAEAVYTIRAEAEAGMKIVKVCGSD